MAWGTTSIIRPEEMFIVFDGQAEFTIDGRTSVLQGTVRVPCRMGHSHADPQPLG